MLIKEAVLVEQPVIQLVRVEDAVYGCDCCGKEFTSISKFTETVNISLFLKDIVKVEKKEFCCYSCAIEWIKTFEWDDTISFMEFPIIQDEKMFKELKNKISQDGNK